MDDYTDSYTYDGAGRLTLYSHNADGSARDYTEAYTYDDAGRLTLDSRDADPAAPPTVA